MNLKMFEQCELEVYIALKLRGSQIFWSVSGVGRILYLSPCI